MAVTARALPLVPLAYLAALPAVELLTAVLFALTFGCTPASRFSAFDLAFVAALVALVFIEPST